MNNLYPLEQYNNRLYNYFLDSKDNLWSNKTGEFRIISKERSSLNSFKINMRYLITLVKNTKGWKDFINQDNSVNTESLKKDEYIIALIDESGVIKFSSNPKIHKNLNDAIEEVTRLATSNPGKKFAYFKCCGIAVANGVTWS